MRVRRKIFFVRFKKNIFVVQLKLKKIRYLKKRWINFLKIDFFYDFEKKFYFSFAMKKFEFNRKFKQNSNEIKSSITRNWFTYKQTLIIDTVYHSILNKDLKEKKDLEIYWWETWEQLIKEIKNRIFK
jgi:hypothetical protein